MKENNINIDYANSIVNYIGPYIKFGICFNDIKRPFTLLDYYSLTNVNCNDLARFIKYNKIERTYSESVNKSVFLHFASLEGKHFYIVDNVDEVIKNHYAFIVNDKMVEATKEDIIHIFEFLDEHDIPRYSKVIYTALYRKITNFPILPLTYNVEKGKTK